MTVRELIAELQLCDPDRCVVIPAADGEWREVRRVREDDLGADIVSSINDAAALKCVVLSG